MWAFLRNIFVQLNGYFLCNYCEINWCDVFNYGPSSMLFIHTFFDFKLFFRLLY
uniref:Uncharacterized protein n=1 Tax=Meloidogyne enterolobii TaxID=390850 RepID=A0A6V7URJ0_MELEN|nr:unnamed protein product [Meloidogyne enterolobii]